MPKAAVPNPIVVVEYDPRWPELFEFFRRRAADALGDMAARIEHVGSTAVPSLAAKPIIDMDVLLASEVMLPVAIERLAQLGYVHRGDLGVPQREAFFAPENDPPHHLYVCPPQSTQFRRHLAFRDYLRSHPDASQAYADLKISLARQFRDNREAYCVAKTDFVTAILARPTAELEES